MADKKNRDDRRMLYETEACVTLVEDVIEQAHAVTNTLLEWNDKEVDIQDLDGVASLVFGHHRDLMFMKVIEGLLETAIDMCAEWGKSFEEHLEDAREPETS